MNSAKNLTWDQNTKTVIHILTPPPPPKYSKHLAANIEHPANFQFLLQRGFKILWMRYIKPFILFQFPLKEFLFYTIFLILVDIINEFHILRPLYFEPSIKMELHKKRGFNISQI